MQEEGEEEKESQVGNERNQDNSSGGGGGGGGSGRTGRRHRLRDHDGPAFPLRADARLGARRRPRDRHVGAHVDDVPASAFPFTCPSLFAGLGSSRRKSKKNDARKEKEEEEEEQQKKTTKKRSSREPGRCVRASILSRRIAIEKFGDGEPVSTR